MPSYRGMPCCSHQAEWLPVLEAEAIRRGFIKYSIDFYQLIGGAPKSGGTHTLGGVADMAQIEDGFIILCREMGAPGTWPRYKNWDGRGGIAHTHSVMFGCWHNARTALYQITSAAYGVFFGKNGLANRGSDPTRFRKYVTKTRTWSAGIKWAAKQLPAKKHAAQKWVVSRPTEGRDYPGVGPVKTTRKRGFKVYAHGTYGRFVVTRFGTWYDTADMSRADKVTVALRPGHYNLPAGDKLGNVDDRVDAAVALIAKAAPTFIGFNELEPVRSTGGASDFTRQLDQHLPGEWRWVKPKLPFNENYIAYRYDLVEVLASKDVILDGNGTGRRHLTMCKMRDRASGFEFAYGVGHLVDGGTGAGQSLKEEGRQAGAGQALKAIRSFAGGLPCLLSFDANTAEVLSALTTASPRMYRVRNAAEEANNRNAATYTNYSKTKPSNDYDWVIDQMYADAEFEVVGYSVVQDLKPDGTYVQPRASDHDPIVASVRATHTK